MARSLGASVSSNYASNTHPHPPSRKNVIATASTKEKLDWLLSIPNGATHGVNYKTHDFAAEALKITHGKGVDVILDFVGQTHWKGNIDSLAVDGRMTIFALLSGEGLFPYTYGELRARKVIRSLLWICVLSFTSASGFRDPLSGLVVWNTRRI